MDQRIIDLYDEYTHAPLERRVFIKRLTALAGSTAGRDRGLRRACARHALPFWRHAGAVKPEFLGPEAAQLLGDVDVRSATGRDAFRVGLAPRHRIEAGHHLAREETALRAVDMPVARARLLRHVVL